MGCEKNPIVVMDNYLIANFDDGSLGLFTTTDIAQNMPASEMEDIPPGLVIGIVVGCFVLVAIVSASIYKCSEIRSFQITTM